MDLTKVRKCSQFMDKAHAVGMVACLEDHFARISKRLDAEQVPKIDPIDGSKYTVEQRVSILIEAFKILGHNQPRLNTLYTAIRACPGDLAEVDGEELNEAVDDETPRTAT